CPSRYQKRELRDLDRAAPEVDETLNSCQQRQAVRLRAIGTRHARRQPPEQLPIAANPTVLAPSVREIAGRVIVVDGDVGGETRPRVISLDQVVRQERVLGEAAVRRLLERIDVVDPFAREASLPVEILIDIGYRGGIRIDAGVPRVD